MLSWLTTSRSAPPAISDARWQAAVDDVALCGRLPPALLPRLRELTDGFLHRKHIHGTRGLALDDEDRLRIALLCCLPVVALGGAWLRGWSEVIVYPGQFRVRRESFDEDSGVVTEGDDWLAGESWQQGPLILSLEDIRADLEQPFEGFNLVAHEIAHKLDMLDGYCDGVPPLPDRARHDRWVAVFQREYETFCRAVESGRDTALDPYAAEAPDEFFAVASETYFSAPDLLQESHPAVHAELRAFYGVEPG